uniref:Uncharacterized protein n=1 Tax=Myotis myotis TaxID=51298 RepID=A0A7J7UCY6_MYOMY|nr:hypothetical protein mMyoMyo1_008807 [Myotis myotis]
MTRKNHGATVSPRCKRPSQNTLLPLALALPTGSRLALPLPPPRLHPSPSGLQGPLSPGPGKTGRCPQGAVCRRDGDTKGSPPTRTCHLSPIASAPRGPQLPGVPSTSCSRMGSESVGSRPRRKPCPLPSPNQPR